MQRVATVTGAGSGIGRAAAVALLKEGYSVALCGRRAEMLEETATRHRGGPARAMTVVTDVTDPDSVARLFAVVAKEFGRLDVLFNNAGIGAPGVPLDELTVEQWQSVVDVNLTGAFLCTQRGVPDDEGAEAAWRSDHQQRIDLGLRAAAELRALHGHQARDHRPDEIHLARRPASTTSRAARSTSATRPPR